MTDEIEEIVIRFHNQSITPTNKYDNLTILRPVGRGDGPNGSICLAHLRANPC